MLRLRDWAFSIAIHLICALILVKIPLSFIEDPPPEQPVSVELLKIPGSDAPSHSLTSRDVEVPLEIPTMSLKEAVPLLPEPYRPEAPDYIPEPENRVQQYSEPQPMDWTMPEDPFFNESIPEDPLLDQDLSLLDNHIPGHSGNFEFTWAQGDPRKVQYIPQWDSRINEAIDRNIQRIEIVFNITSDGYLTDIHLLEESVIDATWSGLIENWVSRIVFSPGMEEQGLLTLYLGDEAL